MHSGLRPILIVWMLLTSTLAFAEPANDAAVTRWIDGHLPEIVALYEHLHAHPELSLEEHETAARVAQEFRDAGLAVTTSFGATGVVGVLRNGSGPVVLLRGDMDGLPLTEETGAPYASQVVVERPDGTRTGVMHACGHDVHTANLVGTVRMLAALKDRWRGTLLAIAQPAEEIGQGALKTIVALLGNTLSTQSNGSNCQSEHAKFHLKLPPLSGPFEPRVCPPKRTVNQSIRKDPESTG